MTNIWIKFQKSWRGTSCLFHSCFHSHKLICQFDRCFTCWQIEGFLVFSDHQRSCFNVFWGLLGWFLVTFHDWGTNLVLNAWKSTPWAGLIAGLANRMWDGFCTISHRFWSPNLEYTISLYFCTWHGPWVSFYTDTESYFNVYFQDSTCSRNWINGIWYRWGYHCELAIRIIGKSNR